MQRGKQAVETRAITYVGISKLGIKHPKPEQRKQQSNVRRSPRDRKKVESGAIFHKCALQVNPHGYKTKYRGQPETGDAYSHAKEIVERAAELDISVLAITNHNDVSGIPAFQQMANGKKTVSGKDITIFPGFEIASQEGIHLLCIYPTNFTQEKLGEELVKLGTTPSEVSESLSQKYYAEILEIIRDSGGIAIAAHVTNEKGLLRGLSGQGISGKALISAWKNDNLLAIQIPDSIEGLDDKYRKIIENKKSQYKRIRPASPKLAIAVINAKDVVDSKDLEDKSTTCMIKMSNISIEGLRQAFLDPESRIRLNSEPQLTEHSELLSIKWEGGFLDQLSIDFNTNLNVLIGGRGTGKSTIIESIRYVMGLEPRAKDILVFHKSIIDNLLKNGTKVSIRVRIHNPSKSEYVIERTVPNTPVVRILGGEELQVLPSEILQFTEVYGQHELSEIARDEKIHVSLLDKFLADKQELNKRKADSLRDLQNNRQKLLKLTKILENIEDNLSALPGLEERLRRFTDAGVEDRLRLASHFATEESILTKSEDIFEIFEEHKNSVHSDIPIDLSFLSDRNLEMLPNMDLLKDLRTAFEEYSNAMQQRFSGWEKDASDFRGKFDKLKASWQIGRDEFQNDYEKALRELQRSMIDGEEFMSLRREIEQLQEKKKQKKDLRLSLAKLRDSRRTLVDTWNRLQHEEYMSLQKAAKKVSNKLKKLVRVEVHRGRDREILLDLLDSELGGRLSETRKAIEEATAFSLSQFVEQCQTGVDCLRQVYKIPDKQAKNLAEAPDDLFFKIEELELPNKVEFQLNVARQDQPAEWRSLNRLSTGQKATIALMILLLESKAPLIVDQPEDDLDNRFIAENIIPAIRKSKNARQFIFASHNANIPVLGDAELIIGLSEQEYAKESSARIKPEHMGSIDSSPVKRLVEKVLEGGKEAFERRRRKYGF